MNDQHHDKTAQDVTKAGVGRIARSGLKGAAFIFKKLLAVLLPIIIPLAGKLLLFFIVFTILFLFPKFMMESKTPGSEAKVVSIFNLGEGDEEWTEEMDQALAGDYIELSNRTWQEGHESKEELIERLDSVFRSEIDSGTIPNQQGQAKPHRLPWSVMAGIDRVVGDPITHRDENWLRKPDPETHFETLRPTFAWQDFRVLKKREETRTDSNGNSYTVIVTYTGNIKLLDTVETFEANYRYHWSENVTYRDNEVWSIMPKLETVEKNGPYFEAFREHLASYGVEDDLELEMILELAEWYDDEYKIDAGIFGARVESFQADLTKQYYHGKRGAVCLPVPVEYFRITSPFGWRTHPVLGDQRFHSGIDLGAPSGTPIYSAFDGVVIWAGNKGGYGKTVIVDHGNIKTLYAHMSAITAHRGKEVSGGDTLGLVGSTGMSTGPHLHFEIIKVTGGGTQHENPMDYF
ncbi:peptidoglycan DD-metalloendopeptidase family protein [Desulfofalx alkaliphila]|uniref:peptidoglycan DD-metalloendopeptidase family protein n=1 Tax=Desulfofalx alkaliphila TaxID=105483 RepID=UPI00068C6F81|nr:peptidoglycan DD-metalloendopeptidase family protein [Desulfofalx alkaliphila]